MKVLYESYCSIVKQCEYPKYPSPVCLKRSKTGDIQKRKQLENEYTITASLAIDGVRRVYDKTIIHGQTNLVLAYFEGITLKQYIHRYETSLLDKLQVAINICQIVGGIHQHHIIHKDLNPANILIQPDTKKICVIDFGIASKFQHKTYNLGNPEKLEGTLAYISPEQTGRINRTIDWRTDLYALGITFYELFTGFLPFQAQNAVSFIHAHITQLARSIDTINPSLPPILGKIVAKLMAKEVKERYQSAKGLQLDLERCLTQLKKEGKCLPFPLATQDILGRLQIPEKLYGRKQETDALLTAYQTVVTGTKGLVLIGGKAGVGKTALAREIHKPVLLQNGFFIEGKFEQFQRNIPYKAWLEAFDQLIKYILTENETNLSVWKNKILAATGTNARLLTDVLPSLTLLIGQPPESTQLTEVEAKHRFNYVMQRFVRVVATKEHPLVIFIDDWQWADVASQQLLRLLMDDKQLKHVLIIGAYRNNEITTGHPFLNHINHIQQIAPIFKNIILRNLFFEDITDLVQDTLGKTTQEYTTLANLLFTKTHGNAFFVNQLLRKLYDEKLLTFNFQQLAWDWDIRQLIRINIADNLVDLMVEKVKKLPLPIQQILQLAACIGTQFDLQTLSIISEQSIKELTPKLEKAFLESLLLPIENGYKLSHDEVYKAIYSLIPTDDLPHIHHKIGKFLYEQTTEYSLENHIFEIVNQWNIAISLIVETTEKIKLAILNYKAAQKAKAANAYPAALNYLQIAISLLPNAPESWKSHYELALSISNALAKIHNLLGQYEEMERYRKIVLENTTNVLDKVEVEHAAIQAYIAQHELDKSVNTGLQLVKRLGISFPKKVQKYHVLISLLKTKIKLAPYQAKKLYDLPKMTNPAILAAMRTLGALTTPAYFSNPDLLPLLITKQVRLSIRYGNAPSSTYAYTCYAAILSSIFQNVEQGHQFGELGLQLAQQFDNKSFQSKAMQMFNNTLKHRKEPLINAVPELQKAYEIGLETGDLESAALSAGVKVMFAFEAGKNLLEVLQDFETTAKIIDELKQKPTSVYNAISHQMAWNMAHSSDAPTLLIGDFYDERHMLSTHVEKNDQSAIFHFHFCKTQLACFFSAYDTACEQADKAFDYIMAGLGTPFVPIFQFYAAIAYLIVTPKEKKTKLDKIRIKRTKACINNMKKMANTSPTNYSHKYYLLKALQYQTNDQVTKAKMHFDKAITTAQKSGFVQEEGIVYELIGQFYLHQKQGRLAAQYLQQAYTTYEQWGATAKMEQLAKKYQGQVAFTTTIASINQHIQTSLSLSSSSESKEMVNKEFLIKATQALTKTVTLTDLLERIITIFRETMGAEEVVMIAINEEKEGTIQAAQTEKTGLQLLLNLPLANYQHLTHRIVNYVLRTQEPILVENAWKDARYVNNPYIQNKRVQAILCFPIFDKEQLTKVVYLENNTIAKAFTATHLQLVTLLAIPINLAFESLQKPENF